MESLGTTDQLWELRSVNQALAVVRRRGAVPRCEGADPLTTYS